MSNYIVFHKPFTPIIDRFKALLKERDEEMRIVLAKDDVPRPSPNEILRLYNLVLSELTLNSKPLISELTTIAGDQGGEHAEAVAGAICARIIEAPVELKLPSLYLLDSIVKNIGREYATYFSAWLPKVFCEAYTHVHPNFHPPMRHLFGTWSSVFPYSVLRKIEAQLQFDPSVNCLSSGSSVRASESPQLSNGIHVNPRYLEARIQLESPTAYSNSQYARQPSSSMKLPSMATVRSSSPFQFGHLRSLSPTLGESPTHHSPIRVLKRVPPSHVVLDDETDRHKRIMINNLKVENGNSEVTWQNIEEEEFNWEEMKNTTLADSSAKFRTRREFETQCAEPLETNITSSCNWSVQGQPSKDNDSCAALVDGFPSVRSGHGFINKKMNGFRSETKQLPRSRVPHKTCNPLNDPQSLKLHFNAKESQGNYQMHVAPVSSSHEHKPPFMKGFQNSDSQFCGPSFDTSRTSSSLNFLIHQEQFDSIGSNSTCIGQSQSKNNSYFSPQPQFLHQQLQIPEEVQKNLASPVFPAPLSFRPPNFGYITQVQDRATSTISSNPVMGTQSAMPILSNPNTALPTLSQGPMPLSSNSGPINLNTPVGDRPGGVFSGLISSLMAQGLISLAKPANNQESTGLEFNPDLHKIRHEIAITALYTDLPRQCRTCGLRFKSQQEHRKHMDWHVSKNRLLKNPKQKSSRKWFVSVSMWLSIAEALGNDISPRFEVPETIVEMKHDEEMAVPADEDQTTCALCGEHFDDFYSDVTEEWMYKEAVYIYAPAGSIADIARSQLGPIVHAKCRPESSERGYSKEECSTRKHMRS